METTLGCDVTRDCLDLGHGLDSVNEDKVYTSVYIGWLGRSLPSHLLLVPSVRPMMSKSARLVPQPQPASAVH